MAKKWIWVLSNFVASIGTCQFVKGRQCLLEWNLKDFIQVEKERGKFVDVRSSSFAHVLYKTSPMEVIRRSCALDVKEMYWKARCTNRAVVLLIKIIVFWRPGRRRCRCLSSLIERRPDGKENVPENAFAIFEALPYLLILSNANEFPGDESLGTAIKFNRKKKKTSPSCVNVLHKMSHQEISRRGRAMTARKCTTRVLHVKKLLFRLL